MTTKKIWLLAMVFGIIAAGMMFLVIKENQKQPVQQPTPKVSEAKEDDDKEAVEEEVEEELGNEMIPVTKGNRAMTIPVTDVQGVAGFIEPGSHVDVVVNLTVPEEQEGLQHDAATLLLQNVKVLAIGHSADDEETMNRYQMVTIEVTPVEGLTLSFAAKYDLHLLLREEGDNEIEPDRTHVHEDDLHKGVFRQ